MAIRDAEKPSAEELELQEAHKYYGRTLRTWLIVYGIGGPVLLISNKDLAAKFQPSQNAKMIIYAFLAGLAGQLLLAFAYKTSLWYLTYGERYGAFKSTWRYKASLWITDAYGIELLLDFVTCAAFAIASFEVAKLFLAP